MTTHLQRITLLASLVVTGLLTAPQSHALMPGETPTVFSLAGSVLKITGGRNTRIGGNAIYVYTEVEPDGHRTFVMSDFSGHDLNVAGPGCVVDPADPSYVECPADAVRTIKVSLNANPLNDFYIIPTTDPATGQRLQYPLVTSIAVKSSGAYTELDASTGARAPTLPMFPNLTKLQIKTKGPFVQR